MHYVYVLKARKSKWLYIGYTSDLEKRLTEHRAGNTYTTSRLGITELIYYEAFTSETDAKRREKQLKNYGAALGQLKKRIEGCLGAEG